MLSSFSKLSLAIALFCCAGCAAELQARPAYAVYAGYESYPHTVYQGRTVYYFDDGWHYRHGHGWVHVDEAPDLYHYRTRSRPARYAPPAHHHHHHHRRASEPSHRDEEHRRSAPSAD